MSDRCKFWEAVLTQRGSTVFCHPDDLATVTGWVQEARLDWRLEVAAMPEPVLIKPGQVFVADGVGPELGIVPPGCNPAAFGTPVFTFR